MGVLSSVVLVFSCITSQDTQMWHRGSVPMVSVTTEIAADYNLCTEEIKGGGANYYKSFKHVHMQVSMVAYI